LDTDLKISSSSIGGCPVLKLAGEVDAYTCPQFREALIRSLDAEGADLVLDMQDVEYIDSNGLGALVGALKRASEKNGHISIVCSNPQVTKVFRITGLVKVFDMHTSLDEALNGAGRTAVSMAVN